MDVNRRVVLKGLGLSSIAGFAMSSSTSAFARAAHTAGAGIQPQLALVNDDPAASVFLDGAVAAAGSKLRAQSINQDLHALLDVERQLRSSSPMKIIGLLDDATGTLVVDLARSAGARVQWLGQHTAHGEYTRHHLLHAGTETCAQWLGRELHACGAGFHIVTQHQGDSVSPHPLSGPPRASANATQWASALGYLLALGTAPTCAAPASFSAVAANGHFVSFSIELGESDRG